MNKCVSTLGGVGLIPKNEIQNTEIELSVESGFCNYVVIAGNQIAMTGAGRNEWM
jgi:hypothetical protein